MELNSSDVLEQIEQDMTAEAADSFVRLVVDYFRSTGDGEGRVSTASTPEDLARRFRESMPSGATPLVEVARRFRSDVLPDSNHLMHPRSLGHQVSAPLPAAVWAEMAISALNQSGAVWEMSPVGTIIETQVVRWMCDLAGLGPEAGGTFTSGGTEATFGALLAARAAALPDAWQKGIGSTPPVVVCGEHAHYGVARAVGEIGIGTDNISVVPSRAYRMDVNALDRVLQQLRTEGRPVMAVVATAGTTATGSFDDLEAIGQLCEREGTWLHVDAAHGGSALLSSRHKACVKGIGRAQSIAWDPHKMMLMPLTASVLLVSNEKTLEAAYSQQAPYLFHKNGNGGRTWDQGLRTFTCSRRLDAFKVWVALQRYGADGIAALYNRLCDTAHTLYEIVRERDDFEALNEPESNIVCFRFVGSARLKPRPTHGEATSDVRRGPTESESPKVDSRTVGLSDSRTDLDALNNELRAQFNRSGEGWITVTSLNGKRVLRVTVMNPRTTERDLRVVVDKLGALARELVR